MNIKNSIDTLPWHPTRRWSKRLTTDINKIIVHQELGDGSIERVNKFHIGPNGVSEKGCPHFCYHFGIQKDGTIVQANEVTDITWHTVGQNTTGIGIMLVGNFSGKGYMKGEADPMPEQMQSLNILVNWLMKEYRIHRTQLFGHSDFGKPDCPGFVIDEWIAERKTNKIENANLLAVNEIQYKLKALGFYQGFITNQMDYETLTALKKFQNQNCIEPTGFADSITCERIIDLCVFV